MDNLYGFNKGIEEAKKGGGVKDQEKKITDISRMVGQMARKSRIFYETHSKILILKSIPMKI